MMTQQELLQAILDKLNEQKIVSDKIARDTSDDWRDAITIDVSKFRSWFILIKNLDPDNTLIYKLEERFVNASKESTEKTLSPNNQKSYDSIWRGNYKLAMQVIVKVKNYRSGDTCRYQIEYIGERF